MMSGLMLFHVSELRIILIYNLPRHCLFLFVTSSLLGRMASREVVPRTWPCGSQAALLGFSDNPKVSKSIRAQVSCLFLRVD